MSCSRTQHCGGRFRTPDLSLRSPTLYHWATALPRGHTLTSLFESSMSVWRYLKAKKYKKGLPIDFFYVWTVSLFLAHLSRRLTRWAYSIPMVRPSSYVVCYRPHFQTWISLKPVGQSWSNLMCSITGVGERLHKVLGQTGSKLVSMATESPHWLIIGKTISPPFLGCFWSDPFYTCR